MADENCEHSYDTRQGEGDLYWECSKCGHNPTAEDICRNMTQITMEELNISAKLYDEHVFNEVESTLFNRFMMVATVAYSE